MAGAAGLQNRAGLQQQLLQRGLVTKAAYSPGYQVLRPDGHIQPRGKLFYGLDIRLYASATMLCDCIVAGRDGGMEVL